MPRLSDSMEEGTIVQWLVEDGVEVDSGTEIALIETDKATMAFEAEATGVLRIHADVGEALAIGAIIATIDEPGIATQHDQTGGSAPVRKHDGSVARPERDGTVDRATARVGKASPLARRLAGELGLDLAGLTGTGPGGRIVKADVLAAAQVRSVGADAAAGGPVTAGAPRASAGIDEGVTSSATQPLTRVQETIARRMSASRATVPDFSVSTAVDMAASTALRQELKTIAGESDAVPSINDMIVKACGLALRDHPRANGSYEDGGFRIHSNVNVGVAVAGQDALIVPVVHQADRLSLGAIAARTRELARAVRDGSITAADLAGGTFTVSNLGMYGVESFTAVVNMPQAAILAVGELADRAVVRDGELVARPTMNLTLSCDHRILYGADAARFLALIRLLLEQPLRLVVG